MSKLCLTAPQTLPLDKLEIHADNVRKSDDDQPGIVDLAADIAARGLLQSLSVRPLLDPEGAETGCYGIQAGSRRFHALKLLVKQKKIAKNAPIPCIVKLDGYAEADSLAENTQRQALKPLDEFRAFKAMADKGHGIDTIAAAFRVSTLVVRQRMRLANASPVILAAYEQDDLTLEQLMGFCLVDDHARQNDVWTAIAKHWDKSARTIRRMLTEKTVATSDPRALFVGTPAYGKAGGIVLRDLFDEEEDGYLQDPALLERLVDEKFEREAETLRAEGWKWVQYAVDFPWNHQRSYLPIKSKKPALSDAEQEECDRLAEEHDQLIDIEDPSDADNKRLNEIIARIDAFDAKAPVFETKMKKKAGVFVSLNDKGKLHIDRGYIRPDDIKLAKPDFANGNGSPETNDAYDPETGEIRDGVNGNDVEPAEIEDSGPPIPDRLRTELTAYRTLALRDALANNPDIAHLAVLHALVEKLFYQTYDTNSCLQLQGHDTLPVSFPALKDFPPNQLIDKRHTGWGRQMPENEKDLWHWLVQLDHGNRQALFAHCAGLTVNAVFQPHYRHDAKLSRADTLATALRLDMTTTGWKTTAENYFGRVTKAVILEAVEEAKGTKTVELIADLKKNDMAQEAERLLHGTGWIPELMRTAEPAEPPETALPAFLDDRQLQAAE